MQFIEVSDLKMGMRLARPIYDKKGVLLFERNSKLSEQSISSVKNNGLLGIYILDPAEPLPPMSEEDEEFERFQNMTVFMIQDELNTILQSGKQNKLQSLVSTIVKNYGHMSSKINFYQNLRSRDDYVFRHSLNVAMLCALITHVMNIRIDEQLQTVEAALVHDIGKEKLPKDALFKQNVTEEDYVRIYGEQLATLEILDDFSEGPAVKRLCMHAIRSQYQFAAEGTVNVETVKRMPIGAKILIVANRYDEMTAMDLVGKSESEVVAMREFYAHPELYDPKVVEALVQSINILFPGVSVELNIGEKALVLIENPQDILRPTVLMFRDNQIMDLSLSGNKDIEVMDIVKTLDNRYIMDNDTLKQFVPSKK